MINNTIKYIALLTFFITSSVFGQNTEADKKLVSKKDKTLLVKSDSVAVLEVKKKAAAQEKAGLPKPYHPEENAEEKIAELLKKAQDENKNIIIQAGGNWCIWCLRFNDFVLKTPELQNIIDENYLYYHLNWSPENKNEKIFAKYGNPGEKFGYPVFIILDKNGKQIHTQDSAVLEEGKGYSLQKTKDFFNNWLPK